MPVGGQVLCNVIVVVMECRHQRSECQLVGSEVGDSGSVSTLAALDDTVKGIAKLDETVKSFLGAVVFCLLLGPRGQAVEYCWWDDCVKIVAVSRRLVFITTVVTHRLGRK